MTPAPVAPSALRPDTFAEEMDAFLPWMETFRTELELAGGAIGLSVSGNSSTSLTLGTGTKTLTMNTGKGFVPGQEVLIAYTTTPASRMLATVTSYDSGTGVMVCECTSYTGSGTFAAWSIAQTTVVSFDGQTYTDLRVAGKVTETVYALTGTDINPANGSIQTKTLSGNTTFTESLADGQSLTLMITKGAYTITWPTITWAWGSAPIIPSTGKALIVLFQVGGTVYGVYAGSLA